VQFGTLTSLQRLVTDREINLPDGTQLIHPEKFKSLLKFKSKEHWDNIRVFPIHPNFRIALIGKPSSETSGNTYGRGSWFSPELSTMFLFIPMGLMNFEVFVDDFKWYFLFNYFF